MPKSQPDTALVLWDVDRTLLRISGVGRSLYEHAFASVTGRPLGPLADMAGRTERAILTETLEANGIDVSDASTERFYAALGTAARELADGMSESGHALPGAADAVAALRSTGAVQSVVTGNIRTVAEAKLSACGLTTGLDLAVGGYGDDGTDRADLVRRACVRAAEKYGTVFPGKRTFVVGDTPHDIKGARDAGVRAVGVATGTSTADVLRACGADLVLADLTDPAALRDAVLGR